jgi:radical SAM superfamily enzyme YgiQ (UPF0313 family)
MSGYLKSKGHEVSFFETTFYDIDKESHDDKRNSYLQLKEYNSKHTLKNDYITDIVNAITNNEPDYICISFVESLQGIGLEIINNIYKLNIPIIVGGISVILNPKLYENIVGVSYVCDREAESFFNSFFSNDKTANDIVDINTLPYEDFEIFPKERLKIQIHDKEYTALPISTSRGCPFTCSYCAANSLKKIFGRNYHRKKNMDRIESEIIHNVKEYGMNYIYFSSETFLDMSYSEFDEFYNMYYKYKIPFWCQTHFSTLNDDRIKRLKQLGCDKLSIGMECGDELYRSQILKKRVSNAKIKEIIKLLDKHKIYCSINNMIGLPFETKENILSTIELNKYIYKIMPHTQFKCYIYQPYYGTELYNFCLDKKLLLDSPGALLNKSILHNPHLKQDDIEMYLKYFIYFIKLPSNRYDDIYKAMNNPNIDKLLREEILNL